MKTNGYKYQADSNKSGEINYRKGVAEVEEKNPDQYMDLMKQRMVETTDIFHRLDERYKIGINKDMVFGEFGAERAQRVLALIHRYNLNKGYAFDISPDMLNISKIISENCFRNEYQEKKLPHEKLVLVADDFLKAKENIKPQQLDFVFCFATIHHFPDPRPVFKTVHSLLKDGGYFYFDREALKSWLGLHEVARFRTYLRFGKIIEREYGILETQFSLKIWKEAFDLFEDWDIRLKYPAPVLERLYNFDLKTIAGNEFLRFASQVFGGRIYGILRKGKKLGVNS
jgi:SAM-dependent methyltransferase